MWGIIKYILFAPYRLCYQALSTPTPKTQEKELNYELLYNEAALEIKKNQQEAKAERKVTNRQLQNMETEHANALLLLKSKYELEIKELQENHKIAITKITTEKEDLKLKTEDLQSKNEQLIQEIQNLIQKVHDEIKTTSDLKKELQEQKAILLRNEREKKILDEELLKTSNQLKTANEIQEKDISSFAHKRRYLPPEESDKLKTENRQLTEKTKKLAESLLTVRKEINHIYEDDVKISHKLIDYVKDSTKIKINITGLTTKHNTATKELEETRHNLINTDAEINSYAQIKDNFAPNLPLDISSLQARLRDLGYAEDRRTNLMLKLDDLSNQASILSKKIEDQTILYSKRNDMLVKEINDWISDKAKYYAKHDIPLQKEEDNINALEQYATSLKTQVTNPKGSLPWNIEREKEHYTYKEYAHYLDTKKYEASHKYVPDFVRMTRERELVVMPPKVKDSVQMKINLPYQSRLVPPHPYPPMQEDLIRKSMGHSRFVIRNPVVNPTASEKPIYISKPTKQITAADSTTTTTPLYEKHQKTLSYYDSTILD